MNEILVTIFVPVMLAFLSGGGLISYLNYRASRPKNLAEAKQISVTAELSLSEGWQKYAEKLEKKIGDLEKKFDTAIEVKDREITRLNTRVAELEDELRKYEGAGARRETGRSELHRAVDTEVDKMQIKR